MRSQRFSGSPGPAALCLLVAAALIMPGCSGKDGESGAKAGDRKVLRFSAIPDKKETLLKERFAPVAKYLSKTLGVDVEYVHATKYSDSVELFRNGDIQLAWFGGLTGVQARHHVKGARAIAQGVEDPEYYSYFIAHKDAKIPPGESFPKDLAGKSFTFGSEQSTSGRLMPEHFILQFGGKSPKEFFSNVGFSGAHDKTAELVQAGTYQAGALNYKTYDGMVKDGRIDPKVCRVVWKTPVYADYNFTAHPDLETMFEAGFTDRLQRALIDMKNPDLLAAFPRKGLIAAKSEDFDAIADIARALGFIR